MPNYESEVRKNLQAQLEELKHANEEAKAHYPRPVQGVDNIINYLETLISVSDAQYQTEDATLKFGPDQTPDKKNENPLITNNSVRKAMGEADYARLLKAYTDPVNAIISVTNDINNVSEKRINSARRKEAYSDVLEKLQPIMDTLAKDNRALKLYKTKKEPVSFQQLIAETSTLELNIGKKNLGTVGAALSKRIPFNYTLPDGKEVNGVFTPKRILDPRQDVKAQVDKMEEKYPGFKSFIDKYQRAYHSAWGTDNSPESTRNFQLFMEGLASIKNNDGKIVPKEMDQFREQLKNTGIRLSDKYGNNILKRELEIAYINIDKKDPDDFEKDMNDFLKQVNGIRGATYVNTRSGIKEGSRIDSRNSAMSEVANMLGVSHLLAKSTPMVIEYNGNILEGTFMEKGKGMDYDHPTPDAQKYTIETFKSDALKSIADLQVLDYLCGNTDRHMANMLYQFNTTGEAKDHKFSGIQGIDNDCSFGEITGEFDNDRFPNLGRIDVISKSMANKLDKMNRFDFKFALNGFGLSEAQREAAAKRLDELKDKINLDKRYYDDKDNKEALKKAGAEFTPGKIRVVDDDQFGKLDPEKLPNNNFIYHNIKDFGNRMKAKVADAKDLQTEKVNRLTGYSMNPDEGKKMEEFLTDMKNYTGIRGTSAEFERLRTAVGKYSRFCKNVMDGGLNPADYQMRMDHLEEIRNAGVAYMKHKGLVGPDGKANPQGMEKLNSYAQDRVRLVAKISAESVNLLEKTDRNLFRERFTDPNKKLSENEKKQVNDFEQQKIDNQVSKAAYKVKNDQKASEQIAEKRNDQSKKTGIVK